VQDAIAKDLAGRATCEALAGSVGCSCRHLTRMFAAEAGITIKAFQTELRMDLARRLLTESTLSLERIAERCGFGSVQAFRANWDQREDVPPSALRPRHVKAG
jgi:transcriptional regulator GlxA family with amidase domain